MDHADGEDLAVDEVPANRESEGKAKMKKFFTVSISIALLFCFSAGSGIAQEEASAEENPQKKNGLADFLSGNLDTLMKANNIFFPSKKKPTSEGEAAGEAAGETEEATEELFTLNFNNAGIDNVLKFISDMTGKVVMRDDGVQGQITIIVPEQVNEEQAMRFIEQAFALKKFTLHETDSVLLVLPTNVAKQMGLEVDIGMAEEPGSPRMKTQIVEIEHANAGQLKEDLKELISENAMMIADPRTNQLIITDSGTNIARLTTIIKELDRAEEGSDIITKIFPLKYTDASQLASALDQMMLHMNMKPGAQPQKGPQASPTKILADTITNCLIVSGPEKDLAVIRNFVDTLDRSGASGLETTTIKLNEADANELAEELNRVLRRRKSGFHETMIGADEWTNSIIVSGYPEDIETVKRLAKQLDERKSADKDTRVYVLEEADCTVLSDTLSSVLTQSGGGYSYYRRYYGRGDDEDEPQITEDTRLNALVITAKREDFEMIEALIEKLDVALPESKEEPRIYPLQYADARDVADLLSELFSDRENTFGGFFFMSRTSSISGLSGKIKAIADPATNSVVVIASSPRGFEVVEGLLKDLDRVSPEFGSTMVVELKHANAEELAESLTSLFEEDPRRRGRSMYSFFGRGGGTEDREISNLVGNVRVVADNRTNSLMVTTPKQNMDPVKKIIEQLDRPTSQVLVDILIVELSSDSDRNLGIQWGEEDGRVEGSANFRFQTPFLEQDFAETGERFRSTTLTNSQFSAVLNILAKSNNTNVVARPNILTANNKEARVNVGREIQYFTQLESTETGTLQETDFRDVGLTLVVTPQVNESTLDGATGVVTLDITVTTGDQALDVAGLPAGLQAFTNREVETNVTVEHGMTVVLSGVIDETWTDSEQGIPGLSKIPLLGNVFKNKRKIRTKTELITFITPTILDTSEQIQEVTDRHMDTESYQYWLEHKEELEIKKQLQRQSRADRE